MLKYSLKVAWRNLRNNKGFSALNILGLAIGMAVALLIGLWVYCQYSYDRFAPGYRQVYRIMTHVTVNGDILVSGATSRPLSAALKKDIPGIQYVAQTDWMGDHSLVRGEHKIYTGGAMAEPDFLRIFQYPLSKGSPDLALKDMYSIVLTESTASALFGNEDPMNQTVRIDNAHDLKVTGILKDLPANSTIELKYIVPFSYYESTQDWVRQSEGNWRNNSFQTFLALAPNADYSLADRQIKQVMKRYDPDDFKATKNELFIRPMSHWHLYTEFKNGVESGGLISYVRMFALIGILVLLIACINFTNLSTARSEKRAREVGIRKTLGSLRGPLILNFLLESLLITFIAALLATVLVWLALPAFEDLSSQKIDIPYSSPVFWGLMAGYILVTGLLAGSRPAFYLSSFNPAKVLKGAIQSGRGAALSRKILVVIQFSCSIALIISTIIIYQQIQHAKDRPMGYDADRLLMNDADNDLNNHFDALKNELLQSRLVSSVTRSSSPATAIWSNQRIDDWQGKLPNESLGLATIGVCDADYFKTMRMTIKEGRGFTGDAGTDSLSVILNESAVKRMRYKQAINQSITWHDVPQHVHVIGVVKDALMSSPFSPAEPTIFIYTPLWSNIITYRLAPTVNTHEALARLSGIFSKYDPSSSYSYQFVDKTYASKFMMETLIGTLSGLFAILAILISCLGLFGLAAYMAEQRNKEIGVRKVLGASISQVWFLLSRDFIVLVLISCVIASPIALYFLRGWLSGYDYRITIGPGVFVAAAVGALVITLATISFQAIRAALANPVKSLRAE
jgi:putative ABC transport system permease protein